ncbi:MAG: hypothetical protein K9K65_00035 [Desulfarculaceae bacterium]|nr:hypothetical protein [Desulfarculaceae bacterium]MCF8046521.1 hypothetical protein [Desulfarculaceae bacterium]MCF8064680.1 hypothetical protein [Desulfarculaceae bacterium]MCF8096200.1 hypothetical protein [Desulfarculaceae bacterium]MCF8123433.1 hypothetical protein [Desulfarculaceae bacterium]
MARSVRILVLCALLLCLPLIMAMGTGSSEVPTRIPEPKVNYLVTLTDMGGTTVELSHFSIEGVVFLAGEMGRGELAVPLDKVKDVVLRHKDGEFKAEVALADGSTVLITVKGSLKATGKTSYGNYRIPLEEVGRIQLRGVKHD